MPHLWTPNLQRETLRRIAGSSKHSTMQRELAALRIAYSEESKLLTGYINQLVSETRIYPTHWPAQTSGRWSTWNPPITNWPRACINPTCQATLRNTIYAGEAPGYIEHEWTDQCWSVRDILLPDEDEFLTVHDHDNIEGRIHDLIVNDQEALEAHTEGYDLHTITCCRIFGYSLPSNLQNPHVADEDREWRANYHWQGKDTKQRVLAKNFNHGSKYTKTWRFVYRIQGIEKYGITHDVLGNLARRYIASKEHAWARKLDIMGSIQQRRIARSLYGFRRVFYDSSEDTAREGFSHMISATVSDYNNMTLHLLEEKYGNGQRLLHNAHDGDKIAWKKWVLDEMYKGDKQAFIADVKSLIERPIEYEDRSLIMTAGIKVYTS